MSLLQCQSTRWSFLLTMMVVGPANAIADEPLYAKNLSPVAGLLGLPSQRDALTQPTGSLFLGLHGSAASHFVVESRPDEIVNFDGETQRLVLELRYGLAEHWDIQLELPWLRHSGGVLDSSIDNWHELWGFGDGGRDSAQRDLLDYRYASSQVSFDLAETTAGLGDISVSLSRALYHGDTSVLSAVLGYKFGSGDEQDFLGSGADDLFLALRYSAQHQGLSWHGQLGYLRAGDSDLLGVRQEQDLWFAGVTLDWAVLQSLSLIAQLDAHAAPMDSELTGTGEEALLLALGARWKFSPQWALDLSFIEDLRLETAPDFTLQASLRYYGAP